jgi:hypothetical protein
MKHYKSVHVRHIAARLSGDKMMCKEPENSDLNQADEAPQYDIDEMIKAMTPDTFPDIVDWGKPVGQELF